MYTVYQLVSRIPLPTSLTLGHLPPGGRFVGRENKPPSEPGVFSFEIRN